MNKAWNHKTTEKHRLWYEDFKEKLVKEARYGRGKLVMSDQEIATNTGYKLRTVQRFLKQMKELGIFTATTVRFKHPTYGWCVDRTLRFREEDLIVHHNLGEN